MAAEQPLLLVVELEPTETAFFSVGMTVRVHLSIVDAEQKQPAAPDTLTLNLTPPYTTPTTPSVTNVSTGVYYTDVALTAPGKWRMQYQAVLNSINCGSNTVEVIAVQGAYW